jgi:hypothetical protein
MNSYLQNHNFMGMLPSPHEAEKQGLPPQDIFPHMCSVKILVLNVGVSHHKGTSYSKNHKNRHPEFMAIYFLLPCSQRWATQLNEHRNPKGDMYNVYVWWLSPPVLCIGSTAITSGYDQVRQFVDSS